MELLREGVDCGERRARRQLESLGINNIYHPHYQHYDEPRKQKHHSQPIIENCTMEEDRAQANLGADPLDPPLIEKPKQPKKRFVGRRNAEKAETRLDANGTIKDSGAVQGI